MASFIDTLSHYIWSYPVVGLCFGLSLFFTIKLKGIQFRGLGHAFALIRGKYDQPHEDGHITHFQALSSALSGTIGIGNIGGVAIAISLGGPGAIFWMWVMGLMGMATKFAECTLGTHFREKDPQTGEMRGGPMYYIEKGLGKKWRPLALFYGGALALGAFGFTCLFQSNQAAEALSKSFGISQWITGVAIFAIGYIVIVGGIRRIGKVASRVVPAMCVIYLLGALTICLMNITQVPAVFSVILSDAFTGQAAAGGVFGTVLMWGVRRAIFSNEAGLGSASIAHAAVKTEHPVREGVVASLGPLIDTVIVCTATAMVIILSGFYGLERFQPTGSSELAASVLKGNWIETAVTESSQSILTEYDNDRLYRYEAGDRKHQTLLIPVTLSNEGSLQDGIRFSYFQESGDMMVRLLKEDGSVITTLGLMPGKETAFRYNSETQSVESLLVADGLFKANQWNTVLLKPNKEVWADLPETVFLEFQPVGRYVSWTLDRFHVVNDVEGVGLTIRAFDSFFPGFGSNFVAISIFFFAISTLITWYYYGKTAMVYCAGKRTEKVYQWAYITVAFLGTLSSLSLVIGLSDIMMGIIVIPNAIALFLLAPKVVSLTSEYFQKLDSGVFKTKKYNAEFQSFKVSYKQHKPVVEDEKVH